MENNTKDLIFLSVILRSLRRMQTATQYDDVLQKFHKLTEGTEAEYHELMDKAEAMALGEVSTDIAKLTVPQGKMESILEIIKRNVDHQPEYEMSTMPIGLSSEDVLPVKKGDSKGSLRDVYGKLVENLRQMQDSTPGVLAENLLNLLFRFATNVPSSDKCLDVSLYDFVRVASSIAICLYENNKDKTKHQSEKDFLLVGGDFSGIQSYIYQIVSKYAGKSLKGRSFYLTLLSDAVVRKLLAATDLRSTNIIYNSGGCFYLLAPNTKDTKDRLDKAIAGIEKSIFETHGTQLFVAIDYMEFSATELVNKRKEGAVQIFRGKL